MNWLSLITLLLKNLPALLGLVKEIDKKNKKKKTGKKVNEDIKQLTAAYASRNEEAFNQVFDQP